MRGIQYTVTLDLEHHSRHGVLDHPLSRMMTGDAPHFPTGFRIFSNSARTYSLPRVAPDHLASIACGVVRAEIHVHLHADRERARLGEVDQHFHHVDVSHVALAE
jgi:hypothetical protein